VKHKASKRSRAVVIRSYNHGRAEDSDSSNDDEATQLTTKVAKKSPSGHHRTTLSGYILATKARIDNRKKTQYLLHMFSQYVEVRPING